jgi:hypothetical protein
MPKWVFAIYKKNSEKYNLSEISKPEAVHIQAQAYPCMPKMELKSCWTVLLTQDLFIIYCCFSIVSSSGPLTQDIILSPSEPVLICTSGYTVQDSTYILVNTVCRYPWGDTYIGRCNLGKI